MTTKYPKSACEAHGQVTTSEPVCVACLLVELDRLCGLVQQKVNLEKDWQSILDAAQDGVSGDKSASDALARIAAIARLHAEGVAS